MVRDQITIFGVNMEQVRYIIASQGEVASISTDCLAVLVDSISVGRR